jgi:hypothetical protein
VWKEKKREGLVTLLAVYAKTSQQSRGKGDGGEDFPFSWGRRFSKNTS